MASLIIHGIGTSGDIKHQLRPGASRLGRGEINGVQIVHPTISTEHCELHSGPTSLTIRDLGSTNGTFVGTQRIENAQLNHGETFRVGDIQITYLSDSPTGPGDSAAEVHVAVPRFNPVEKGPRGPLDCTEHDLVEALYYCKQCANQWCGDCIKTLSVARRTHKLCPRCSGKCVSMEERKRELAFLNASFLKLAPSALGYPVRGNGPLYIVAGAIFFGGMDMASRFGFLGMGLLITIAYFGYLFSFLKNIIQSSANGEKQMPGFPDFSNWYDDMVLPFFEFAILFLICLGPGLALQRFASPALGYGVLCLGMAILPMALLAVSMADSLSALNPVVVFSSIAKIPVDYILCVVFLIGIMGISRLLETLLASTGIPVFPAMISSLLALYGTVVETRLIGLLYYTNRKRLGWFD